MEPLLAQISWSHIAQGEEDQMLGSDAKQQLSLLPGSFGGLNSHVGTGLPHADPKPKLGLGGGGHYQNANKGCFLTEVGRRHRHQPPEPSGHMDPRGKCL